MSLITISDPLASSIASISQVIVATVELQKVVLDKATPEQVEQIVDDLLNLYAPFRSLVLSADKRWGIATFQTVKPQPAPEAPK